MIIGSYGLFWERDLVDFESRGWRLLGRNGSNSGTLRVADFRKARGVYVLYNDVGVYYVGLASGSQGLGRRLKDHMSDTHGTGWSRFSWFAFDSPDVASDSPDGVLPMVQWASVEAESKVTIRDLEALLQRVTQPFANANRTHFADADEWVQVATQTPTVLTFDDYKNRLR